MLRSMTVLAILACLQAKRYGDCGCLSHWSGKEPTNVLHIWLWERMDGRSYQHLLDLYKCLLVLLKTVVEREWRCG
ncbi:hypothetical protein L1987_74450 [Smallanthus sonchifolius]|uniref:Uncharacterized protein n=1 Tax=Smallanthus sonchifolius TaxID=185202 RepID=A0ACB9A1Z8_9ASTR|nr:hypothetical protein L1987_74450 [Smallanthus sonchifolius]